LVELKYRWHSNRVLFVSEVATTVAEAVIEAVAKGADLGGTDLGGANLGGADLGGANLGGADLGGANLSEVDLARLSIVPCTGSFHGWKKCLDGVLVRLEIPADAKRSNSTGRKCRAEFAKVLEVVGAEVGISLHDGSTQYRVGETVRPDSWDENRWEECSHGIHFFITKVEAAEFSM
jgi:hypothetical protein